MQNQEKIVKIFLNLPKGPSIKDVCTKSRKLDSPLVRTGSTSSSLSMWAHYKLQNIRSFLRQKVRDVRIWRTPPLVCKISANLQFAMHYSAI